MPFLSLSTVFSAAFTVLSFIPTLTDTAVNHFLGRDERSVYHDLKSLLVLAAITQHVQSATPMSITEVQEKLMAGVQSVKGRMWVAEYTTPGPKGGDGDEKAGFEKVLVDIIRDMSRRDISDIDVLLDAGDVEAEWTGYRPGASIDEDPPYDLTHRQRYDCLQQDTKSNTTILYLHGGAYYLMDPATHRQTVKKLAKDTGGKALSVRYRLAPQHPFPAALCDALVSYMGLLYPKEGAFHEAIRPEDVVFAGDSAGGNLAIVLARLVLEMNRRSIHISWDGRMITPPMPAGVAVNSPWCDLSMTTVDAKYALYDYIPPSIDSWEKGLTCVAWPTTPRRSHVYCADVFLDHPLVQPVINGDGGWKGMCPVYACCGWEILAVQAKYWVTQLRKAGVPVVFEEYEGMPHCFAMVFSIDGALRCFDGWSGFIADVTTKGPRVITSSGTYVRAKTLEEAEIPLDGMITVPEGLIERFLTARAEGRLKLLVQQEWASMMAEDKD